MPNNRYQSYENYDYNTPRRSHYGEGRRLRDRNRDYFDDYNDFEDNTESNFSYADDDDNPIYAQPGFSGEQPWGRRGERRNRSNDDYSPSPRRSSSRIGRSQLGSDIYNQRSNRYGSSPDNSEYGSNYGPFSREMDDYDDETISRTQQQYGRRNMSGNRYGQSTYNDNYDRSGNEWDQNEGYGGYESSRSRSEKSRRSRY